MRAPRLRAVADPPPLPGPGHPPHDLGEGRLERGIPNGPPQKVLRIDATGVPASLVGRLLIGSYITGQDRIFVVARGGLKPGQRGEIHRVAGRLLSMSVVADGPDGIEVQNFIDPGRHELPRLLHHVVELLRQELEICRGALEAGDTAWLGRIDALEEEVDRLYLLMARQLLLSSDNSRVAQEIDVPSHHFQLGYRIVAKVLEVFGDLVQGIGHDLEASIVARSQVPRTLTHELGGRVRRLDDLLARSMAAFAAVSVVEADAVLNRIAAVLPRDEALGQLIAHQIADPRSAAAAQRIVCNLVMALEMLVVINEITINRSVEPETVAVTGTNVLLEGRRGRLSLQASHPVLPGAHFRSARFAAFDRHTREPPSASR
jgi:phosphate uptake regulator